MSATPPRLPNQDPQVPPPLHQPPPMPRQVIAGTEGMGPEEVEDAVLRGGRFVFYPFAISLLVVSLRRSSSIRFLKPGQDGAGAAFGYSLLSLLFGWWGFPWGPIWTLSTVFTNLKGGTDVTPAIMSQVYGAERAQEIMQARRPASGAGFGMMLFRTAVVGAFLSVIAAIAIPIMKERQQKSALTEGPGYQEYAVAKEKLGTSSQGSGNCAVAVDLAQAIASGLNEYVKQNVTGTKKVSYFSRVWCGVDGSSCLVLVDLMGIKSLSARSREVFAKACWEATQSYLDQQNLGAPAMELVIGVSGDSGKQVVMSGLFSHQPGSEPASTVEGVDGEAVLVKWFQEHSTAKP